MVKKIVCALWTWGMFSAPLFAEFVGPPSTSGGIIEKEIQKEYEKRPVNPSRELPPLDVEIPEERLKIDDGISVDIETVEVRGNDVLPDRLIRFVTTPYEKRELTMRDIQELCLKLQATYVSEGYFLATVYPPPQDIENGRLVLQVIEGKLGRISVRGNKFYKESFILGYFAPFRGKAVHYDRLFKKLFLLNENSDMRAGLIFKKGAEVGTTDLIVKVEDARPFHFSLDQNNFGSKQNTVWRTGSRIGYGNLARDGDTLSVFGLIGNPAENLKQVNVSYKIPLNAAGSDLTCSWTYSGSRFAEGVFPLSLRSLSNTATIAFTQAIGRSKKSSTNVYASFQYKQLKNYAGGQVNGFDKLREITVGWNVDYIDALRGRNLGDLSLMYGIPHFLGGLHTVDDLCTRQGGGGLFAILKMKYNRIQGLPKDCLLRLYIEGQATPYKLPLSEQTYVGGFGTVRGFPSAWAVGDSGYFCNLECYFPPPFLRDKKVPLSEKLWKESLRFIAFIDQGGVSLNGGGEDQKKHRVFVTSAGFAARLFFPRNLQIGCDVGFPFNKKEELNGQKVKDFSPVYYFRASIQPF